MKKLSKRKVKQRRKVGIAKAYMSRAAALKKLQVPLSDFRRLCILKGVYPVEPKNKSKLGGANTNRKTYFFTRDVLMLMQEPILYKFSEFKVFMRKLTRAQGRHDLAKFQRTLSNKPFYKLDTIVKERYPRFVDALRDCDDALSMCFLFAMLPKGRSKPDDLIDLSRKLTLEFMHYIINSKSLRKVFISIKGYYYQAEIMNQTITWVVPHQFVIENVSNVDLSVMKTFTEFYVTLLGFINYKLYKSINAVYPPQLVADNIEDLRGLFDRDNDDKRRKKRKLTDVNDANDQEVKNELVAALNKKITINANKLLSDAESADQNLDTFEEYDEDNLKSEMTVQEIVLLERLFKDLKFFLNREAPRESLTFIIRSFGGEVSWDKNLFPGATFDESDSTITHQIVDRSSLVELRLDRVYIQPQWVYDSINARTLLPTNDYIIGATLPPHLSPFVKQSKPESTPASLEVPSRLSKGKNKSTSRSKMTVKAGRIQEEDEEDDKKEDDEVRRMNIKMIPKKKKRLFDKITRTQKQKKQKTAKLRAKKRIVDAVRSRQTRTRSSN